VTSTFWLSHVETMSAYAAAILPILGGIWLVDQIVRAIMTWPQK